MKNARKKKKLTLRKLASLVGVSRQTILDYENLRYPPRPEIWEKLKVALDLPGEFSDYFDRTVTVRGKYMKYTKDSICTFEGCTEKPVAKGYCRRHYCQMRNVSRNQSL